MMERSDEVRRADSLYDRIRKLERLNREKDERIKELEKRIEVIQRNRNSIYNQKTRNYKRIKALENLFREWREKADAELNINAELHTETAHQDKRIKELKDIIIEYSRHQPGCPKQWSSKYKCNCGWDREREKVLKG